MDMRRAPIGDLSAGASTQTSISQRDRDVLRALAGQVAEIAALPVHQERIDLWTRLNGLERVKPMVWINEIPWHEMDVDGELALQTSTDFCRAHEQKLRRILYQWRHMPGDMIVENVHYSPLVIDDTGFGIDEDVQIATTDSTSDIYSRRFHLQILEKEDLEKIEMPRVTHDVEASERRYEALSQAIGDILPVVKRGAPGFWFAPWDELIRWWGVQQPMTDLVDKPDLVHAAMDRLVTAYLHRLDQYVEENLLARNDGNVRIGSGGLGYSDELPQAGFDTQHVRTVDLWGCGTAQIFVGVSPAMHEEFALQYERRWMSRFGLNYYGCCEPLDLKIDMLRSVPGLRKVSMSPWGALDRAGGNVGTGFVFSRKPSPAAFAEDAWSLGKMRDDLVDSLERTRGCVVEVIMKDISTVRYQPQRLWEWAAMATEVTESYA